VLFNVERYFTFLIVVRNYNIEPTTGNTYLYLFLKLILKGIGKEFFRLYKTGFHINQFSKEKFE